MDVTFKIGTLDLHSILSTYNVRYETTYQKVITTLNGVEHSFPAPFRPILTFSLFPLTDLQNKSVYDALSGHIEPVTFTDTHAGQDRTLTMRLTSDLEAAFGLKSIDGNRYYKGGKIELRAK